MSPKVKENPMKEIFIDKVVINIGVGESGERLLKAEQVIKLLTKHQPVQTISRTTNKDLGIRKMMPIGLKATLRGKDAEDFIKRAFWVKENKIAHYSFDQHGNFSFGIPDYTNFENMKYDPKIGIFGMDISVSLKRRGYRISRRKKDKSKPSNTHQITRNEGIEFAKKVLDAEVI